MIPINPIADNAAHIGVYADPARGPFLAAGEKSPLLLDNHGRVLIGSASDSPVVVAGSAYTSGASVTRPSNTTAYNAGDVLGAADSGTPANAGDAILEFASIGPAGRAIILTDSRLRFDVGTVGPAGSFRLHLYSAAPTAILDNAAWDLPSGDRAAYLGYIELGAPVDLGSTLFVQQSSLNKVVKLADGSTSLFGLLVTVAGYTPASGTVHNVTLEALAI